MTSILRTLSLTLLCALAMPSESFAGKMDKVESYERDHYGALVVWFENEKKETKQWLKLKTSEERDQWLKDKGYWDHFYNLDEYEQKEVLAREPKLGWTQEMVYMAWGAPYRKTKSTKRTAQSTLILSYQMIVDKEGKHRVYRPKSKANYKLVRQYTQEIVVDNRVVSDIKQVEGWK